MGARRHRNHRGNRVGHHSRVCPRRAEAIQSVGELVAHPVELGVSGFAHSVTGAGPFVEGPGAPGDGARSDHQRKRQCTRMQAITGSVTAGKRRPTRVHLLLHGRIGRDSIGGNHVNSEEWGNCPSIDHRMSLCARMSRKIGASLRSRARPPIAGAKALGSTGSEVMRWPRSVKKRPEACGDQARIRFSM
jgi:hypothetical protein